MLQKVKISVLMAVYNTDFSFIKRAIESVLKQDFQDFELIIIDDGSDCENSKRILHYVEQHEDKIVYIRHKNRGQSESINRGVLNSVGEFITILDSDDAYKTNHLSACLREIDGFDLIASSTETIVDTYADYYVPDKNDLTQLIHLDDCTLFGTLFGRREVFNTISFKSGFAADADFYSKATSLFRVNKVNLRTYIYYRNIPNSICATIKKQNFLFTD
ncbi:MAG: glycosyltransferase family 2 protein [Saprospiraceae bacterium]|nr:glycosyltransferase family 2 protein [Saprospiraceae bacterium]MBK8635466.1 glycosyltransferase family 2 protein [Saprospiraceae bacterium]